MQKRLWIAAGLMALLSSGLAHAQSDMSEKQKRRAIVPFIMSLTKCIANISASEDEAAQAYRSGMFSEYLPKQYKRCPGQFNALLENYENIYGDGQAEIFIKRPYQNDLPRAVLSLVRPQIDAAVARLNNVDQIQAAEERERAAEAERKAEEQRAAAARAESERQAAEAKARLDKQERIDVAKRSMVVLRDKFYDCVDQQLPGLVKSGEVADVLGNVAMTICGKSLAQLQDSAIEEMTIETGEAPGSMAEDASRAQIKALVKERVVADAVQAKAGVGMFAKGAATP